MWWIFISSALGLYILVSIFSTVTADPNARWKILGIAVGSVLVQLLVLVPIQMSDAMPILLAVLAAVVLSLAFIVAALRLWLKIKRAPALKIAGSYFALCVVLVIVFAFLYPAQK
jgi:hypothetical protein